MEITIKRPAIESVTITLSAKEAEWMATVCDYIGGSKNGPRGMFGKIQNELAVVGIHSNPDLLEDSSSILYFK